MPVEFSAVNPENTWYDKAGKALASLTACTGMAIFAAIPMTAVLNKSFGPFPALTDVIVNGVIGGLGVVGASVAVGLGVGIYAATQEHNRFEAERILTRATGGVTDQLKTLGYDLHLERGGKATEKEVGKLNSQVLQMSKEVHDMLKGTSKEATVDKILSSAFILGNEDKRADMNMLSSLQGMLDGVQILKKDPSLALQADAINSVMSRDKQKRELDHSALSL